MISLKTDENGNNLWTVLLLRPDYIASDFGQDTYLAHVTGETVEEAQANAQRWAAEADHNENPNDYYVLFVCRSYLYNLAT